MFIFVAEDAEEQATTKLMVSVLTVATAKLKRCVNTVGKKLRKDQLGANLFLFIIFYKTISFL